MEPSFPEPTAANNLATAIASLRGENSYAVPNRFEVIITAPMPNYAAQRKVSLRCESVLLPGRNLNTGTDGMPYGPTREIVDGVTYAEEIAMTFQASSGLDERVFFEEWQKQAFDENSWNVGYYNDYVSEVQIYLLDRKDQRRYGLRLLEAFPKTIEATELNQGSNNELIKTSVNFSFRYWETLDANRISRPLGDLIASNLIDTVQRSINANLPRILTKL